MIFQNVYHCNLEKLVLAYKNIVNTKDIGVKYFGEKDLFYFKTVKISYVIDNVSDFDLIIFNKLGGNTTITSTEIKMPKFDNKLVENEVVGNKVWNLYLNIDNPDKRYLLPISYRIHNVVVEFTGNGVLNLLGIQPIQTLKVDSNFFLPSEKILQEILFEVLYKKFYLSMEKEVSTVDLLTDVSLQNQYYKHVNSKSYKLNDNVNRSYDLALASVNTPMGSLGFLDSNRAKLSNELNIIKSNLIKYRIHNNSNSIEYLFVLESDFDTFMWLFRNTNFIINYEDLKVILFNGNRILSEDPDLLEINLIETINTHIDSLKLIYNDDLEYNKGKELHNQRNRVNKLELYNWICGCTQIKYMIKVNSFEVESLIDKLNKSEHEYLYTIDNSKNILNKINVIIDNIKNLLK